MIELGSSVPDAREEALTSTGRGENAGEGFKSQGTKANQIGEGVEKRARITVGLGC